MKKIIETSLAPTPIGPYSQAVQIDKLLFLSGQIAIDPATHELLTHSITQETTRIMENIKAILHEVNYDFKDIVKATIFINDMKHFAKVNEVYGSYFDTAFPARETVAVQGLPKDVNVEISVIAYKV